jgi:hypothetical protein
LPEALNQLAQRHESFGQVLTVFIDCLACLRAKLVFLIMPGCAIFGGQLHLFPTLRKGQNAD